MAGGRLLSCSLAHTELILQMLLLLLLLGVCRHDVEASSCQTIVLKQVGETVKLSSCSPLEQGVYAEWKYGGTFLVAFCLSTKLPPQFAGRVKYNCTDFSLTVTQLTQQDSGSFILNADLNGKQTEMANITLEVYNPMHASVQIVNTTWHPSNGSCTFLLECVSTSDSDVSYNWTVGNRTLGGPRLWHTARPQDGPTTFTCTASNPITRQSASTTVDACRNDTRGTSYVKKDALILFVGVAAGGGCLIVVIVTAVGVWFCSQRRTASPELGTNDVTVYADINDIVRERTPCSVYESIEHPGLTAKPNNQPDTIYDMIQLSRMKEASVSPYQDL